MTTTAELRTEVQGKVARVHTIYREMGDELDPGKISSLSGTTEEKLAEWQRLNTEANDLGTKLQQRLDLEAAGKSLAERDGWLSGAQGGMVFASGAGLERPPRTLRQILEEGADGLKAFARGGHRGTVRVAELSPVESKTLLTLATLGPVTVRQPGIYPFAVEYRTVRDLFGAATIQSPVSYVVETTFTNAAAEVTEGVAKPESALAFTETVATPAVIATWIPATRQILDDLPYMQSYLEQRLSFMVKRREETQLLTGNGTPPNIRGLLNTSGIQTYAATAEGNADAIYKGIVKVRNTGFAEPTAVVINPTNMQAIMLLKTSTGDYIYGSPANPNTSKMLWGLEVRETSAMTLGTAVTGAFSTDAAVLERDGMQILVSTEHSTYFIENKIAILAEERLTLAVYRPASFCTVTALT